MSRLQQRLQIFDSSAVTTTGGVDFTLDVALGTVPEIGGQVIRPLDGVAETLTWSVDVVDSSGTFTANLSDSSGRMDLNNRLARYQQNLDAAGWTSLTVARVREIQLTEQVATYRCFLGDELTQTRQRDVFLTANTCAVWPPVTINDWLGKNTGLKSRFGRLGTAWYVARVNNAGVLLRNGGEGNPVGHYGNQTLRDLVRADALTVQMDSTRLANPTTAENIFRHLRFRESTGSTDHVLMSLGARYSVSGIPSPRTNVVAVLDQPATDQTGIMGGFQVWVVWPTTATRPSSGNTVYGYFHMPTAPPSEALPLHIGGATGITLGQMWQNLHEGQYSSSTGGIRFSTSAVQTWNNDTRYPHRNWWRITSPADLESWAREHLYQPWQVAALLDSSGQLAPTSVLLPAATAVTPANLTGITKSLFRSHPTWEHLDPITAIRWEQTEYGRGPGFNAMGPNSTFAADGVKPVVRTAVRTHDRIGRRRTADYTFRYSHFTEPAPTTGTASTGTGFALPTGPLVPGPIHRVTQDVFDRFGDGAIEGRFGTLRAADETTNGTVRAGDFVRLALETFPNPASTARGSTRIVQIMNRQEGTFPFFRYLDAGPNLQATTAPTVTLTTSTAAPKHGLEVSITGIPSGSRYSFEYGFGTSTSATAASRFQAQIIGTSSEGSFGLRGLPSKTKVFGRAQSMKPNRIRSAFSTIDSAVTEAITGPSGLTVSNVGGTTAKMVWTAGDANYPTEILLSTSTGVTLTSTAHGLGTVVAGATRRDLSQLLLDTTHLVGVRHLDAFGGRSTMDSTTFKTSTSRGTLSPPLGIAILLGE